MQSAKDLGPTAQVLEPSGESWAFPFETAEDFNQTVCQMDARPQTCLGGGGLSPDTGSRSDLRAALSRLAIGACDGRC